MNYHQWTLRGKGICSLVIHGSLSNRVMFVRLDITHRHGGYVSGAHIFSLIIFARLILFNRKAEHFPVDFLTNRKHIIPICPAAEFLALYATAGDIILYSYVCLNTGMIDLPK